MVRAGGRVLRAARNWAYARLCRAHFGAVLTWQGRWEEAERELRAAADDLASARPPAAVDALVRLAELRRRQGRLDEAEKLFTRCEGHVLTPLYRGVGALDAGVPTSPTSSPTATCGASLIAAGLSARRA